MTNKSFTNKIKFSNIIVVALVILILASLAACDSKGSSGPSLYGKSDSNISSDTDKGIEKDKLSSVVSNKDTVTSHLQTKAVKVIKIDSKTISNSSFIIYNGSKYKVIKVDGGHFSGDRLPNVAVNVGFGKRVYWAFTNKYGQLVCVKADRIILQDDNKEPVLSNGRYYEDEADVPGTEKKNLDKGHVIADSLGGVSNAYNITPQNSTLNRHGDQAYMEQIIRDAGGCKNFIATITYPNTKTQIPSKYKFEYVLKGKKVVDEFKNINPDEATKKSTKASTISEESKKLSKVDLNGNGQVTIAEAKKAGYSMPIHSDNWLYKYMDDRDGDGVVGE